MTSPSQAPAPAAGALRPPYLAATRAGDTPRPVGRQWKQTTRLGLLLGAAMSSGTARWSAGRRALPARHALSGSSNPLQSRCLAPQGATSCGRVHRRGSVGTGLHGGHPCHGEGSVSSLGHASQQRPEPSPNNTHQPPGGQQSSSLAVASPRGGCFPWAGPHRLERARNPPRPPLPRPPARCSLGRV